MRVGGFEHPRTGLTVPTPWVKILLIYYAAAFVLELVLSFASEPSLASILGAAGLVPAGRWSGPWEIYRLFTHFLLPDFGPWTFIMNLLTIYFIGGLLEDSMGSRRLMAVFLLALGAGGLGYLAVAAWTSGGGLLGPSAGCLGLLACAATLYPKLQVIFLLFPLPLWVVAAIIAFLHFFAAFRGGSSAAFAYLFGLAGGALYAWNLKAVVPISQRFGIRALVDRWRRRRERRARETERRDRAEMDRILEKINSSGIGSLSGAERRFLDRASRRLRKGP